MVKSMSAPDIEHIELRERANNFGASTWQFINALQQYYSRLGLSESVIDSQQITMAGSMSKDDHSNHLVLFEAKRANNNIRYWYIGEVFMYFEQNLNGTSRFLALVSIISDGSMNEYGIIGVEYDQQRRNIQFM
ncbi:hypothetical protein A0J61_11974, partial [Choanephora cucurbitarum]